MVGPPEGFFFPANNACEFTRDTYPPFDYANSRAVRGYGFHSCLHAHPDKDLFIFRARVFNSCSPYDPGGSTKRSKVNLRSITTYSDESTLWNTIREDSKTWDLIFVEIQSKSYINKRLWSTIVRSVGYFWNELTVFESQCATYVNLMHVSLRKFHLVCYNCWPGHY